MKCILFGIICFLSFGLQAFEYEVQFENEKVSVAKIKIMPNEEIGLHRDPYPHVVIAERGGTITRFETNGTTTDVIFPTRVAVFRESDPPNELHKSVNKGSEPVELIVIQLKN